MQLADVRASLVRRWYLCLLLVAVTLLLSGFAAARVAPTYQFVADVSLLPPDVGPGPAANRFLNLGNLSQAADLVSRSVSSDATRAGLAAKARGADFTILPDLASSAPVLVITATSKEETSARLMQRVVVEQVPVNLRQLQSSLDISPASQITSIVISQDGHPEVLQKARIRAVIGLALACLVAGILLIGMLDGLLLRRSSRPPDETDSEAGESGRPRRRTDRENAGARLEASRVARTVDAQGNRR